MSDVIISSENKDTCWIFVAASHEARHLYDIIYAVSILRKRGYSDDDFYIFVDHPHFNLEFMPFSISKNIHQIADYYNVTKNLVQYKNSIVTVTGHGSPEGIHSKIEVGSSGLGIVTEKDESGAERYFLHFILKPQELINGICQSESIDSIALILCQCYAGIFDHLKVPERVNLCTIGSTKLSESLSLNLELINQEIRSPSGTHLLQSWMMAIFMVEFFGWIAHPKDIDGDNSACIIDAYKWAATRSNGLLKNVKSYSHRNLNMVREESAKALTKFDKAKGQFDKLKSYPKTKAFHLGQAQSAMEEAELNKKNLELKLEQTLSHLHTVVEPWLRNEGFGKSLKFK